MLRPAIVISKAGKALADAPISVSPQMAAAAAIEGRIVDIREYLSKLQEGNMTHHLTAIIEREGDEYVALCPETDIASQGKTIELAKENLREALELFFETASPEEIKTRLHGEIYVTHLEVRKWVSYVCFPEKTICHILSEHDFQKIRQKGSHIVMQLKKNNTTITVPVPNHSELCAGTITIYYSAIRYQSDRI